MNHAERDDLIHMGGVRHYRASIHDIKNSEEETLK